PEDLGNRALLHLGARGLDGVQVLGLPEHVDEAGGLPPRAAHLTSLGECDPPGADRRPEQHQEHKAHEPPRADEQLTDRVLRHGQGLHREAILRGGGPETDQETQDLENHPSTWAGPRPPLHTTWLRLSQGSTSVKSIVPRLDPAGARWVYAKRPSRRVFSKKRGSFAWRSVSVSTASGESAATRSGPPSPKPNSMSWRCTLNT